MALTNNEKQIRHKKLEQLKAYGKEVLITLISMNSGINRPIEQTNEEIKAEIEAITSLQPGWTDEDFNFAVKKLENKQINYLSNPFLMHNDITNAKTIQDPFESLKDRKKAEEEAYKLLPALKSVLQLSKLKTSDKIAVVTEVLRNLATNLLDEKIIPKTYANATALSLIDPNYEKPEWTWSTLAKNIYIQNSKEKAEEIAKELLDPNMEQKSNIL